MSTTLYEMAHSPFCIPIVQAFHSCGIDFNRCEVPNWDRSSVIALTNGAYYQVPVLVHDGEIIYELGPDTQEVAHYVDRKFAGGQLFPKRLEGMQEIMLAFIENELESHTFKLVDPFYIDDIEELTARVMVIRHKERKFGRGCIEQWREQAVAIRRQTDALLQRFEITLKHSPFLFGDLPLYSDFALFGILGNLTFRGYNRLSAKQTALAAWIERMNEVRIS